MDLGRLNSLDEQEAVAALLQCCGSTRWARLMAAARPFADADALADTADRIWASLAAADWLEAFAAHPRIGSGLAGRAGKAGTAGKADGAGGSGGSGKAGKAGGWSGEEQAGVRTASADVQQRLALANRQYEARFGYIFIVCATGKTADEMLAIVERRLQHDADKELAIAAEEQRKITRLRLAKLLDAPVTTT